MTQQELTEMMELGLIGLVIIIITLPIWLPIIIWQSLTKEL